MRDASGQHRHGQHSRIGDHPGQCHHLRWDVGSVSSNALGTNLDIAVGAGGVAAGNTIVVGFASRGATTYNTPVVADSAANTYTLATNAITYGHGRSYIYFAHVKNALANGNKITITTSSVSNRVAVASVFSGLLDTNLLDKALANPVGTSTSTNGNNRVWDRPLRLFKPMNSSLV